MYNSTKSRNKHPSTLAARVRVVELLGGLARKARAPALPGEEVGVLRLRLRLVPYPFERLIYRDLQRSTSAKKTLINAPLRYIKTRIIS